MFCKKCGKELEEISNFCPHCGFSTNEIDVNPSGEYIESYKDDIIEVCPRCGGQLFISTEKKNRGCFAFSFIILGLLGTFISIPLGIIIIIIALIFLFSSKYVYYKVCSNCGNKKEIK